MTQSVIGALRVNLGLDSAKFERGVKRSGNSLQTMGKQFAVVAGAAAAMGAALSAAAIKGANEIDKAAKAARRLDASIGGFRALELAAGEAGANLSSLTDDLQSMNRELANIGVAGNADRALKSLGMSAKDLVGLDADEKLARIADQIQKLGLNSGQTTAILRDFGIRNRSMILLVGQGGDVIRKARKDIEDYGLAVSTVDSARIEKANDAIGRLSYIWQYASQQLAIKLVPAMGAFAQVMTDSLREGGLLRAVIDGLVNNLDRLATYTAVVVGIFGAKYVDALVAARLATFSLAGAVGVLKAALMRLPFLALVVGATELILFFGKLYKATGSFGGALGLLREIAAEVWDRMGDGMLALGQYMKGAAYRMKAWFVESLAGMTEEFNTFVNTKIRNGMAAIAGWLDPEKSAEDFKREMGFADIGAGLQATADAAQAAAKAATALGAELLNSAKRPLDSWAKLNKLLEGTGDETTTTTKTVTDLNDELGNGTKEAAEKAATAAKQYADAMQGFVTDGIGKAVDNMLDGFKGGLKSIKDIFVDTIKQMIAYALKNKIMLSLGLGGAAGGGTAAMASGIASKVGGIGGMIGTALGGMGTAFMSGASGLLTGGISGAMTAISGATGALGTFAAAAGAIALPLLAVGAIFSFFKKKTELLDSGLRVTVDGMDALIETFSKTKTTRFFGLSKKISTTFTELGAVTEKAVSGFASRYKGSNKTILAAIAAQKAPSPADVAAGEDASAVFKKAISGVQQSVFDAAALLDIGADAFSKFSYEFKLSLKGMSEDEKAKAVNDELLKMGDAFAAIIPNITSMNELLAAASQRYDLQNRLLSLQGKDEELLARMREQELNGTHALNQDLLKSIYTLEDKAIAEAKVTKAMEDATAAADALSAKLKLIADERFGLETRLLQLQGNTAALRARELDATYAQNRGILNTIYALEDRQKAEEAASAKAKSIADERSGLEKTMLELQGKTSALRRLELLALDPLNRALQKSIYALQDRIAAEAKATAASEEAAAKVKAITDERTGLEKTLLDLQGNTAELRRRELLALNPANRALQVMIWGLEDAKKSLDAINETDFATLFDFRKARAFASQGRATSTPIYAPNQMATVSVSGGSADMNSLVAEVKAMRAEQRQLGIGISTNTKKSADTLRKFDIDGLPATRT